MVLDITIYISTCIRKSYLLESDLSTSNCSISSELESTLTYECFSIFLIPSNFVATSFIVGLSSPFKLKHFFARFATSFICSALPSFAICFPRTSNYLFFLKEMRKYVTRLLSTFGLSNETAFLPTNSSTMTTLKL